jgi:hypothetical protein
MAEYKMTVTSLASAEREKIAFDKLHFWMLRNALKVMNLQIFLACAYFTGRESGKVFFADRRPTSAALKSA